MKRESRITLVFFHLVLVCIIPLLDSAYADPDLVGTRIDAKQNISTPGRVAVGPEGNIYIVDSYKNRVQVLDGKGAILTSIPVVRPSAVAISRDGTLYIGSHKDYSVTIYKHGRPTGKFGDGANEFSSISALAIDSATGDVYVADGVKNTIKIYYSSGVLKGTMSGFDAPTGVAVREAVYVLDAPLGTGSAGGKSTGSRISVLSKSGSYVRSIDERGTNDRNMMKPVDIAVDALGNIFIADAARNSVLVYGRTGACTGEISNGAVIKNPVALAFSKESRLYISSSRTQSIIEIPLAGAVSSGEKVSLDFQSMTGGRITPAALGY